MSGDRATAGALAICLLTSASCARAPEHAPAAPVSSGLAPSPDPAADAPQAAAASASTQPAAPGPPRIDPATLEEPPIAWSHPTNGAEPLLTPRGVWVIEPDGARASLLDPASGGELATAAVPGVELSRMLGARRAAVALVAGHEGVHATLTRVDPTRGRVLWHARDVGGEPSVGDDGTGLSERAPGCATALRDADTGRRIDRTFKDALMSMHGHDGMPPGTMCRRATWVHLARGGVTLVGHGLHGRSAALSGVGADGAIRYTIEVGDAHPRVVHPGAERATLVLLGQEITALSVVVQTGKIAWRRVVVDHERCAKGDGGAFHAETAFDARGRATTFLLRACGTAQLIDLASGATGWMRDVGSDTAFLEGVATVPWDESREVSVSDSPAVRALSLEGRELSRTPLPPHARDLSPLGRGWVVTTLGLDGALQLEPGGATRWAVDVRFGNSFVKDDVFVALVSGSPTQVAVDGATGRAFVVRDADAWVLGAAGRRWLTSKVAPHRVVALAR